MFTFIAALATRKLITTGIVLGGGSALLHAGMAALWHALLAPTSSPQTAYTNHIALVVAAMPVRGVLTLAHTMGPVAYHAAWYLMGG
jgi:hypothetical protein